MKIKALCEKIIKNKNFKIYLTALILLAVVFSSPILFKQIRIWTAPPSSQSDYPVLPDIKDIDFGSWHEATLDELSLESDLVALVEIEKIYDISTVTYTPEEGTSDKEIMDKLGMSDVSSEMRRVDLKVKNIIKGEEKRKTVSVWEHEDILYMLPDFKPGDEFIFFLGTYNLVDGYVHRTAAEGIYYLAQDNKVYPSRMTNLLAETSGMDYNEFKDRVKNHMTAEEIAVEREKALEERSSED